MATSNGTTTAQRTPEGGWVYTPADQRAVPDLDIFSVIFDSEYCPTHENKVIHADAVNPANNLTKWRLRETSQRFASLLRHGYGIGKNGPNRDTVFIITTNHYMLPAIFFGIVAAEGIFSATSPMATPDELAYCLKTTGSSFIVCNQDTKATALAAAEKVGIPANRVITFGGEQELTLAEAGSSRAVPVPDELFQWRRVTNAEELDNSIACLLFSSGTTGLPKAMKLSHRNMLAGCFLIIQPALEYNEANRPKSFDTITLAHLPVAHIAGAQGYFMNSSFSGGTTYWMQRFDFGQFCHYFKRYKVTTAFTVPPIYLLISKSPQVTDHFDSWVDAVSGAAPMGQDLQIEVSKKLGRGQTRVRQTWGLSETTGSITSVPNDLADTADWGTVGSLAPSSYARMVDDDGKDVEPGKEGELWVKSALVTKGYWNNEKANKESFRDGWFCTGDIGVFKNGWFYIVDRKKELIKYKGQQVAPAELEDLLLSHPDILDAAVIGVPGEGTEVPRAYVVADPKKASATQIADWVKSRVSKAKYLRGGVIHIEAIPKSPSGKILRKMLRDMAKKEGSKL